MGAHIHQPREGIFGMRLAPGAILRNYDLYLSTTGRWDRCPCPGVVLENTEVIWIRPGGIPENVRGLLCDLTSCGGDLYGCVMERNGAYYIVPDPTWNGDSRTQIKRVEHPEYLQDLIDYGYLAVNQEDRVYTLTDEGKHEGVRLRV